MSSHIILIVMRFQPLQIMQVACLPNFSFLLHIISKCLVANLSLCCLLINFSTVFLLNFVTHLPSYNFDFNTKLLLSEINFSIGENLKLLIERPDGNYCFRLHKDRIYYVR